MSHHLNVHVVVFRDQILFETPSTSLRDAPWPTLFGWQVCLTAYASRAGKKCYQILVALYGSVSPGCLAFDSSSAKYSS